jgi:hypothetical protein
MKLSWAVLILCLMGSVSAYAGDNDREFYDAACASCHGRDGRGAPEGTAITVPLPDFTDCSFVTRETTGNWVALVAEGGQVLGLSPQMPGFGDSLTDDEIRTVLTHVRGLCRDPSWPYVDLNVRRPLFTGKAFPEDEVVLNLNFEKSRESRSLVNEWTLEKRLGARRQAEVTLPFAYNDPKGGATTAISR